MLHFDDGREMAIHAMKMQPRYQDICLPEVTMPKSYGTSGGVEITDVLIERLADGAERGHDSSKLRQRGRPH